MRLKPKLLRNRKILLDQGNNLKTKKALTGGRFKCVDKGGLRVDRLRGSLGWFTGFLVILWNHVRHKLWPFESGMFRIREIGKNRNNEIFKLKEFFRPFLNSDCLCIKLLVA